VAYPIIPLTYPVNAKTTSPLFPKMVSDISMRHDAWDQEIVNNGVKALFYKSLPCPNLIGIEERVHPANCPFCGNDQYIYPLAPIELIVLLHTSSVINEYNPQSLLKPGEIYWTFPANYNNQVIDVAPWDRFVVQGVFCRMWTQFEFEGDILYKATQPIHDTEILMSVHSGILKTWIKGTEYVVEDEGIRFLTLPTSGEIFSLMFYTYPSYTVTRLTHDIRLAQVLDGDSKRTVRLPQSGIATRDFLVKE